MKKDSIPTSKRLFLIFTVVFSFFALLTTGCAHQETVASPAVTMSQPATAPNLVVLPAPAMPTDYVIGPGDVIEISVWQNQDLSRVVVVLPDGKITFPLVGRLIAGGKTIEQLKQEIEKRLNRFVPEPELTLIVQQVNSMVVYVLGKVNRPGYFPLKMNVDVLQALAMAGGLNIFADPSDIRIFRKTRDKSMVMIFNYKSVTEDNYLEGNIMLQAGDVIVVK